jgi:hypothetical protein
LQRLFDTEHEGDGMRLHILITAAALALAAGCERDAPAPSSPSSSTSASGGTTTPKAQPGVPTTPSPTGGATAPAERKDTNPVQGQVDPKQREQHKDFQQKGDAAGPTSPDTKPKN